MAATDPSSDFCRERREALEAFLAETRRWAAATENEARTEISFSAPGDWDYDYATDQLQAVRHAKATEEAIEAELQAIRALGDFRRTAGRPPVTPHEPRSGRHA